MIVKLLEEGTGTEAGTRLALAYPINTSKWSYLTILIPNILSCNSEHSKLCV